MLSSFLAGKEIGRVVRMTNLRFLFIEKAAQGIQGGEIPPWWKLSVSKGRASAFHRRMNDLGVHV